MFKAYYHLTHNPFDKSMLKTNDAFIGGDHKEMLNRLNYLAKTRGIGVFTAAPGMGKTFALRCFHAALNQNLYQTIYLTLSTVSVSEFYKQLQDALKLDVRGGKSAVFAAVKERLFQLYKEHKTPMIIMIDEAQYLSSGILKDLKMLMNFNFDSLNCFSLVLVGEPHFNHTLEKPVHLALKQRVTVHYQFLRLREDEIKEYLAHKLKTASGLLDVLSPAAISAIHSLSSGNPRKIDNSMTYALRLGVQMQKSVIDDEVILAAAENLSLF